MDSQTQTHKFDPYDLISISHLSKEWNISRSIIYKWINDGTLTCVLFAGRKLVDKTSFIPRVPKKVKIALEAHNKAKLTRIANQSK